MELLLTTDNDSKNFFSKGGLQKNKNINLWINKNQVDLVARNEKKSSEQIIKELVEIYTRYIVFYGGATTFTELYQIDKERRYGLTSQELEKYGKNLGYIT